MAEGVHLTADCPCTRDCPRHGNCAACVANHRFRVPGVPGCFFSEEAEKWHDRSFAALFRDKGFPAKEDAQKAE